ncbi:MAG: cytochrome c oxidase accessory protein CcoG [Opitutales bacterium]
MAVPTPNRDSVTTIREDGSRPYLFPADVHGRFSLARRWSACALIVFYLSLPWIKVNGYPAVFLDVATRRFHLCGLTLAAQDMWLLFFVISGLGFSLFFVTALLGRVWCGWACPQTVFLDHIYRRIERLIEGDAHRRRELASAPLGPGKLIRRLVKHTLYILVSLVITHLFLAYFVSIPELWTMMRANPFENWGAFGFVFVFAGALYFNFAWFREQLCIVICPYGRLQSALIDDHSLVIGYDQTRGEPRARLGTAGAGDCVACNRCVQVCPTGIDIRQGLQLECIGCAACIDACDEVMTRIHKPRGLVRYGSQTGFAGRPTRWMRPRTLLYFVLLLIGAGVATWALSTIHPASFGVIRMTGAPYFVTDTTVRNQFLVRIVNKEPQPADFTVQLQSPVPLQENGLGGTITVGPMGEEVRPVVLVMARRAYQGPFNFQLSLRDQHHTLTLTKIVEFLGPDASLLREEENEKASKQ